MNIEINGQEINESFIKSASDEQLVEVRETLVQGILKGGEVTVSKGMLVIIIVCLFIAFHVTMIVISIIGLVILWLLSALERTLKQRIAKIDAELARRKK